MFQSSGTVRACTWGMVLANPLVSLHRQIEVGYPFVSATCPRESVLPIRLRLDFSVIFKGYAGGAEHRPRRQKGQKRSLGPIFSGPHDRTDLVNFSQPLENNPLFEAHAKTLRYRWRSSNGTDAENAVGHVRRSGRSNWSQCSGFVPSQQCATLKQKP